MTQLSCADKWWGKLSRPAQRLSSALLFLPNWCRLAAPNNKLCASYNNHVLSTSLHRFHWGELVHYTQVDKITCERGKAERKWDTERMKGRDILKFIGPFHLNDFSFILTISLYMQLYWEKNTFYYIFHWGDSKSDTEGIRQRETDCTDKRNREKEIYCNIICWKSQRGTTVLEICRLKQTLKGCMLKQYNFTQNTVLNSCTMWVC